MSITSLRIGRSFVLGILSAGGLAVVASVAVASAKPRSCANLSHTVRAIKVTGVSCRTADKVIRDAQSGKHRKPDGYSCRSKASGHTANVTCSMGKLRIFYAVTLSTPKPIPPRKPTPLPKPTPAPSPPARAVTIDSATANDVRVTVTWATASDKILIYEFDGNCAATYADAEQQIADYSQEGFEGDIFVFGNLFNSSAGTGTFDTNNPVKPGFSTACALLYDGTTAADTVYATAQGPVTG
jgi:hypothetical protein